MVLRCLAFHTALLLGVKMGLKCLAFPTALSQCGLLRSFADETAAGQKGGQLVTPASPRFIPKQPCGLRSDAPPPRLAAAQPLDRSPLGRNGLPPMRPARWAVPTSSPYDAQDAVARATRTARARITGLAISVKKMNVVAKLVRRLHIDDALIQLALINQKKTARVLLKVCSLFLHACASSGAQLQLLLEA
jgi:hypothetical protein